jgi:hypothetical protein
MAITSSDIQFRLSGGSGNTSPAASIGGAKSSTAIVDATVANLFDNVTGDESAAGDVEYRCFYVHNNHGSLTWQSVVVWIYTNTPSTDTTCAIGLAVAAVNATESATADESSAPASVTFSTPTTKGAGLAIGDIPFGQHKAIWVRRTVTAAASAYDSDSVIIRCEGDTAA